MRIVFAVVGMLIWGTFFTDVPRAMAASCDCSRGYFESLDASGCNFTNGDFRDVIDYQINFTGANFPGAKMPWNLNEWQLSNFTSANFSGAFFTSSR